MRKALFLLTLLAGSIAAGAQTLPGLVLNEVSQGPSSSSKEYFEFVVAGTPTCTQTTLDLRGWIIDDNNGWIAAGSGQGIAAGCIRFANVANWSAVPYGSIILVYNEKDKASSITLPDDPTDANNDKVYVLPASSSMLERNFVDPSVATGTAYPTSGFGQGVPSDNHWGTVALANGGDGIIIVKPTALNSAYFSFGYAIGSPASATVWVPDMPSGKMWFLSDANFGQAGSWTQGDVGLNETPGAPNGGANTTWINSMRAPASGVTVNAISSSNGNSLCVGSSTTLSSTTPSGTWSSANSGVVSVNATTGVATAVAVGGPVTITYTVTSGGCTGTATYDITVLAAANAGTVSGGPAVCSGSTTTFTSNGTPGGSWTSSNPAIATINPATGIATGVAAGSVTITYTVGSGACARSATAPLTVNAQPVVQPTTGNSSVCVGGTVTLTNPAPAGTGTWSSSDVSVATVAPTAAGASSAVVTSVAAGNSIINFTVTSNGCTTVMPFPVTVNPRPSVAAVTGPTSVCVGSTITLNDATAGGTWTSNTPGIATVNPATGVVTGVSGGTVQIQYTVTNGSCSNSAPYDITVTAPPALQPTTGPNSLCVGGSIQLTNPLQPNGSGTWTATPAGLVTLTPTAPTGGPSIVNVTALSAGVASINFTAGTAGCTSTVPFTLTINALPVVGPVLGATNLCSGTTVTVSNATAGGTWSSSNPAAATVNPATGVVTGVATGTTDIIYTVTNGAGCTGSNRATITVTTTPNPGSNTGVATLCVGTTAPFSNTLAGGTWSSSNATIASVNATTGVVTGVAAGGPVTITYTVTNNGCTGTANSPLTVNPVPTIAAIAPLTICSGGTSTLVPSAPGGTWTSDNTAVATVTNGGVVTGIAAGSAQLTYTLTSGGCTATRNVAVTVQDLTMQLTATPNPAQPGATVTFTASGSAPHTITAWGPAGSFASNSATTQTLTATTSNRYFVVGQTSAGCIDTAFADLVVQLPLSDDLFVPNFFTPNADGRNDILYLYGSNVAAIDFRIFNQWGEQVFGSSDKGRGWDGSASGKQQPVGVYMYVAKVTLTNGQTRTLKGSINLIR
ncbi:Ig-like domain-containing protein [Flaviaesturariibacter terrae]